MYLNATIYLCYIIGGFLLLIFIIINKVVQYISFGNRMTEQNLGLILATFIFVILYFHILLLEVVRASFVLLYIALEK